jgi:hypothetical protein
MDKIMRTLNIVLMSAGAFSPANGQCTDADMCPSGTYSSSRTAHYLCYTDSNYTALAGNTLEPSGPCIGCVSDTNLNTRALCEGASSSHQWIDVSCAGVRANLPIGQCSTIASLIVLNGNTCCLANSSASSPPPPPPPPPSSPWSSHPPPSSPPPTTPPPSSPLASSPLPLALDPMDDNLAIGGECTDAEMCPSGTYSSSPTAYHLCYTDSNYTALAGSTLEPSGPCAGCVSDTNLNTRALCEVARHHPICGLMSRAPTPESHCHRGNARRSPA